VFAATFAGLGAWAAQPPIPAKSNAAPHNNNQIALAETAVPDAMMGQNAGSIGSNQQVTDANPVTSGNRINASKDVGAIKPISGALLSAEVQMPNTGSIGAQAQPPIADQDQSQMASAPPDQIDAVKISQAESPPTPAASPHVLPIRTVTTVATAPRLCLNLSDITNSEVSKGEASITFRLRNGKMYRNDLKGRCPDLRFNGYAWVIRGPVCEDEQLLRVFRSGEICRLGKFTEMTSTPGG
jgi:hypothetical protein